MMEVRLPGGMRQRPIRLAAGRILDQGRQAQTPGSVAWQTRETIQLERSLQCVAIGALPNLDHRRVDLRRHAHAAAVAAESICRPLCRRSKVEFVISGMWRSTDKCLEAGMLPKPVFARGGHDRRHADVAHIAGHDIGQHQTIGAPTRDANLDLCRCAATRVRMKPQGLVHGRHSIGPIIVVTWRRG